MRGSCGPRPCVGSTLKQGRPVSGCAALPSQREGSQRGRESHRIVDEPPPAVGWLWDSAAAATKAKLAAIAAKPKKSLGQNFVTDDGVLARIVRDSGVGPGDLVLEVGPGTGNLTKHLLQAGAVVLAVEKDYVLADKLTEVYAALPTFRCVQGDILRVNIPDLIRELRALRPAQEVGGADRSPLPQASPAPSPAGAHASAASDAATVADSNPLTLSGSSDSMAVRPQLSSEAPGEASSTGRLDAADSGHSPSAAPPPRVKLVANLPYYITTELLKVLFPMGDDISVLAFMLQDEVAQRLVPCKPEGSQYRAITVAAHYFSKPTYKFKIDRRHYFPSPKVHGALVTFELHRGEQRPLLSQERRFLTLVRQAFNSKRKKLSNSLQPLWQGPDVVQALETMGLDSQLRPQDLTTSQFVDFYSRLTSQEVNETQVASPEQSELTSLMDDMFE